MASKSQAKKSAQQKSDATPQQQQSPEPSPEQTEQQAPEATEETQTVENPEGQEPSETDSSTSSDEDETDPNLSGGITSATLAGQDGPVTDEQPSGDQEDQDGALPAPTGQVGGVPEGIIIPIGGEVRIEADEKANFAIVNQDVYQEKSVRGSRRVSYSLLYRKGQQLPLTTLRKINGE